MSSFYHVLVHLQSPYQKYYNSDIFRESIDTIQGRIQDFKLGGVYLKKMRRAEEGANIFGVFRVKNHDFTPKNHIFFQF